MPVAARGVAGGDDRAAGSERHAAGHRVAVAGSDRHDAAGPEAGVGLAVGVDPGDRQPPPSPDHAVAGDHQGPVAPGGQRGDVIEREVDGPRVDRAVVIDGARGQAPAPGLDPLDQRVALAARSDGEGDGAPGHRIVLLVATAADDQRNQGAGHGDHRDDHECAPPGHGTAGSCAHA